MTLMTSPGWMKDIGGAASPEGDGGPGARGGEMRDLALDDGRNLAARRKTAVAGSSCDREESETRGDFRDGGV